MTPQARVGSRDEHVRRWAVAAGVLALVGAAASLWRSSIPALVTVGTDLDAFDPAVLVVAGLGVVVHPVLLLPATLPVRPLTDPVQRVAIDPVLAAADEADLPIHVGEESRRSTRVNAVATGLGPTARVVVHDNLLELPADRVASVVAHAVAHHQYRDPLRGVLLATTAALPWLLLLRRAVTAGSVGRRVRVRVRGLRDLADPDPPFWTTLLYRTHPSVGERIRQAVANAERNDLELPGRCELAATEAEQRHPATADDTS